MLIFSLLRCSSLDVEQLDIGGDFSFVLPGDSSSAVLLAATIPPQPL